MSVVESEATEPLRPSNRDVVSADDLTWDGLKLGLKHGRLLAPVPRATSSLTRWLTRGVPGCSCWADEFVEPLEAALPSAQRPAAKRPGLSHRPSASQALGILQFVF